MALNKDAAYSYSVLGALFQNRGQNGRRLELGLCLCVKVIILQETKKSRA
jgi:hypothetical protein